jgi:hypothetical protein
MADAGFWIEEGVLTAQECGLLTAGLSSNQTGRGRAGARHLMACPAVAETANNDRLLRIARRAIGGEAVPYRATLFEKSGRANWLVAWHQDTALPLASRFDSTEWGPWSEKAEILYAHAPAWALERVVALRIHLNASTAENGPLRVIPGSHEAGVLSSWDASRLAQQRRHVDCLVSSGGVLAMRPLLVHASSKARVDAPRRVLHVEYADSLDLGENIRLAVA